jgi:hypothetical protein
MKKRVRMLNGATVLLSKRSFKPYDTYFVGLETFFPPYDAACEAERESF